MELLEQAALLLECEKEVKRLEDELKAAKAERDEANLTLAELMEDNETQSVNYKGRTLYLSVRRQASYDKKQEEEFFRALRENGLADIVRPTVNSRTLTAVVTKELMSEDENGNPSLPEWIAPFIRIYEETKVNIRK